MEENPKARFATDGAAGSMPSWVGGQKTNEGRCIRMPLALPLRCQPGQAVETELSPGVSVQNMPAGLKCVVEFGFNRG